MQNVLQVGRQPNSPPANPASSMQPPSTAAAVAHCGVDGLPQAPRTAPGGQLLRLSHTCHYIIWQDGIEVCDPLFIYIYIYVYIYITYYILRIGCLLVALGARMFSHDG